MRDGLLIILFAVSIICNTYTFISVIPVFRNKVSVFRALVFGTIGYFFAHVLLASILVWTGYYSVRNTAYAVLAVSIAALVFSLIKFRISGIKKIFFDKKETVFFLLIIAVTIFVSTDKFGFYGMGQDQGVYQTKAAEFVYGNNTNKLNFNYALATLDNEEDYRYFRNTVRRLRGYYFTGQTDPLYADENDGGASGLEGTYHGLPAWPSIMALFGSALGISKMQAVQSIFLVCFLMMTFYILENFRIKTICEASSIAVLSASPVIIWISKSALTEMFLAVIIASFIYLACSENRDARLFMWIPAAVFSFYHISAYTMIPAFLLVCWVNYTFDKRKRTVIAPVLILLSYLSGFIFSISASTLYTMFNYKKPLGSLFSFFAEDSFKEIHLCITVFSAVALGLVLSIGFRILLGLKKLKKYFYMAYRKKGMIIKIISFLVMVLVLFFYAKSNGSLSLNHSRNLVALSYASGVFSIILIFTGFLLIKTEKIKGASMIMLFPLMWYVLIWSVKFKTYINYFFYYGRYDVPYLCLVIVFLCVLYRDFEKIDWVPAVCAASVMIYLNYDLNLIKTPDDTKVAWEAAESVTDFKWSENSAVILDDYPETLLEWMLLLRASGVEVYPKEEELDEQIDNLLKHYQNVYFVYEGEEYIIMSDYSEKEFKLIDTFTYVRSEDTVNGPDTWIGFPDTFEQTPKRLDIYLLTQGK